MQVMSDLKPQQPPAVAEEGKDDPKDDWTVVESNPTGTGTDLGSDDLIEFEGESRVSRYHSVAESF